MSDPAPDILAMPRFSDGAIDMRELLPRLAKQVVNAAMDAEADQLSGVSVNIIFTISTNAFSPIAPTRIRRIRQRGCAAFGA